MIGAQFSEWDAWCSGAALYFWREVGVRFCYGAERASFLAQGRTLLRINGVTGVAMHAHASCT
jgi:hypothetical protein